MSYNLTYRIRWPFNLVEDPATYCSELIVTLLGSQKLGFIYDDIGSSLDVVND